MSDSASNPSLVKGVIRYTSVFMGRLARRAALSSSWQFECNCPRCQVFNKNISFIFCDICDICDICATVQDVMYSLRILVFSSLVIFPPFRNLQFMMATQTP